MTDRRRPGRLGAALALALVALATPPADASGRGTTSVALDGRVAHALAALDVRVAATGPARASLRRIALPVADGAVARRATLRHRGAVAFRVERDGRTREVRLTGWRTTVGARRATVTARLGARRIPVFAIAAPARHVTLDAATGRVRLARGAARLAPAAAVALRRALRVRDLPAGRLGSATVRARVHAGGTGRTECEGHDVGPVPAASAPRPRPATATAVTTAAVWWRPKESWIRYINSGMGAGDGATALAPARAGIPEVGTETDPRTGFPLSSGRFVYRFAFALIPSESWYDAASGTAVLHLAGGVRFQYRDRGIAITMRDPEVELAPTGSRLVFRFAGANCTSYGDRRIAFASLPAPTLAGGGSRHDAGSLTAAITVPGNIAFDGNYIPGSAWGGVDVAFTTGT